MAHRTSGVSWVFLQGSREFTKPLYGLELSGRSGRICEVACSPLKLFVFFERVSLFVYSPCVLASSLPVATNQHSSLIHDVRFTPASGHVRCNSVCPLRARSRYRSKQKKRGRRGSSGLSGTSHSKGRRENLSCKITYVTLAADNCAKECLSSFRRRWI